MVLGGRRLAGQHLDANPRKWWKAAARNARPSTWQTPLRLRYVLASLLELAEHCLQAAEV